MREHLETVAPEGFEPVVEVFLAGREAPIVPAYVETSRSPEVPWVYLQARVITDEHADHGEPDEQGERREPDEYWVYVHESLIARVEIRFVRKGEKTLGFGVREADEPGDTEETEDTGPVKRLGRVLPDDDEDVR
jgi:hypothetical protein